MSEAGGAAGRRWRRVLSLVAALAAALANPAQADQDASGAVDALWTERCSAAEVGADLETRLVAARDCSMATERAVGFEDPRLPDLYARLAKGIAAIRGRKAAIKALPYRRRSFRASERVLGAEDPRTGGAALDFARGWILTGRCEDRDPRVLTLLASARRGFEAAAAPERFEGLRAAAMAYADVLAFEEAIETMLAAGDREDGLSAPEWERLGLWRHRVGALPGAADAYRNAIAAEPGARDRLRMRQSLKQVLFEVGDLEGLRALEATSE